MAVIKKARKFGMTLGKNKARRHIYFLKVWWHNWTLFVKPIKNDFIRLKSRDPLKV
jgi:hypothetical protein